MRGATVSVLATPVQTALRTPTNVRSVALDPRLAAELAKSAKKTDEWRERRDNLIRTASHRGASLREIAAAVGLSNPGVLRILRKDQDPLTREQQRLEAIEWLADEMATRHAEEEEQ